MQDCHIFRVLDVELDRSLVAIDREVIGTLAFEKRRSPGTRLIADLRSLDLDHIGAQVSQQHAAIRSGKGLGHLENSNTG